MSSKIKLMLAQKYGPCMGVSRAIKLACKTGKKFPGKTFLLGEIVHNQHVVTEIERKFSIHTVSDFAKIPKKTTVVIRAHGISPRLRRKLLKRKLRIVDATCPLVTKVHQVVKNYAKKGFRIIYLASEPTHDEAVGVKGEAQDKIKIVTLKDLSHLKIKNPARTVLLTQTTLSIIETERALKKLKAKFPLLKIEPHICPATMERQKAVINLAKKADLIVVVGSPTSSNSKRLKETAQRAGGKKAMKVYLVDQAKELKPSWFKRIKLVGVTSGASTPNNVLQAVIKKIKSFNR